jgi:Tol biopolymer transport system component
MNADGGSQINLTNGPESDSEPAWSPDGARIAFVVSSWTYGSDIHVMNADGSNRSRYTNSGGSYGAAWSPDGTRIAFASYADKN